jgi:hypothetical protein
MLYPKEDKENRILLYAVNHVFLYQFLASYLFSADVVNINKQQTILVFMSIRLHMKSSKHLSSLKSISRSFYLKIKINVFDIDQIFIQL